MRITGVHYRLVGIVLVAFLAGCSGSGATTAPSNNPFTKADLSARQITDSLAFYNQSIETVTGKARAFISQPGRTERLTLEFESSRERSLLRIKNRVGIEGGLLYLTKDSVLLYNRVDKKAQKAARSSGAITQLNGIQPVNLLTLLDYRLPADSVATVQQADSYYRVVEHSGTRVLIRRSDYKIVRITEPYKSSLPYTNVEFEAFGDSNGYTLPRKINILDASGTTNIVLVIQDIAVNTDVPEFSFNIPGDVKIERL